PRLCYQFQNFLKTRTKHILCQQWKQRQRLYGVKVQENFPFIPLVLDTDTVKNESCNKILLKSKKSKKPRSKKMKAYIPRDTHQKSHEDLFNSREQNILIVGKPGIGKTTVIQQMLHHWAERHDRKLDFMFYFDENTLSNTSNVVNFENLLLGTFLMSNPELKDNADEIVQYLQEYSEKVTVVFDGIRDFQDNAILQGIMQHELLPEAKLVVTCRPEVEYEFSDWSTYTVYVQGFSEESIYDFFTAMSNNDPELVDSVINNPALFSLCHVPMYAFMVAACISYYTSDEAQKPCTATELYVRIFRHCLQRHGKVSLLQLDRHIKNCRDVILSLAECAFNATKLKTINLEFEFEARGIAGMFLKTVSVVSPAHQRLFCAFHHNTMQEFFSALWLLEKAELLDEVLQLCQNEESKHMKHVIPFLCGLQSRINTDHLKCLLPLNEFKENADNFLKKVFNTFLDNQQGDEYVDIAFICQCLYEYQSAGPCCSFLEEINYHLDLSEEHLDPYTCSAVSYVISQSGNKQVHLCLENSAVSLTGLKTILKHSKYLRYFSTTLCQVWTIALQCEELNYLRNLLLLCGNEMHISMSSQTDVLEEAGKIITQNTEQTVLHLHCDKDPQQLTELFFNTVLSWLPHMSSLQFYSSQGEREREQRCKTFLLSLCLQAALHQPQHIQHTVQKLMACYYKKQTDFLLDLFSRVKQYESVTDRSVLPVLLPVYQSGPPVWSINLSERKVSLLLEVLKLHTEKKPVELIDCSNEESEVRSFLQCLPYISQLSCESKQGEKEREQRCRTFLLDLCLQAALHQPQHIQHTVQTVMRCYHIDQSDFLLDLFSRVKQYESETDRSVLPVLLPVYQSGPPVWSINLSERKVSLLLEVLKLQTEKKPVELIDWSYEESEVRSFLQCLPYISHLRFNRLYFNPGDKEREQRCRTFLLDLCLQAALHQPQHIQQVMQTVRACYYIEQSDFLLDLFSRVKQYESETDRSVLPVLLPVYQS
ncbi:protein NLRC5-like, partial [Clarias magur]